MRLLRRLLIFLLVLVLIVATPIFLLYKNGKKPLITSAGHTVYQQALKDELDYLIDDANADKKIGVFISQDTLNYVVNTAIETALGVYPDSDDYVSVIEDTIFLQGAWFVINEKSIKLNIGAHIKYSGITFKTLLLLDVELVELNLETIQLKVNKLNVGKLPFKFLLKIKPVAKILDNVFDDLGSFDSSTMILEFDVATLLGDAFSNDPTLDMLKTIISENDMFDVSTKVINEVGGFSVNLDLNQIEHKDGYLTVNPLYKISNDTEFKQLIAQKLLLESPTGKISFDQNELLALVDYSLNAPSNVLNLTVFDDYDINLLTPFTTISDQVYFNVPLTLSKGTDAFKSIIKTQLNFIRVDDDLKFTFNKSWWGDILIDNQVFNDLIESTLSDLGQTIVITDFFELFEDAGLTVTQIKVENNKLVFVVS